MHHVESKHGDFPALKLTGADIILGPHHGIEGPLVEAALKRLFPTLKVNAPELADPLPWNPAFSPAVDHRFRNRLYVAEASCMSVVTFKSLELSGATIVLFNCEVEMSLYRSSSPAELPAGRGYLRKTTLGMHVYSPHGVYQVTFTQRDQSLRKPVPNLDDAKFSLSFTDWAGRRHGVPLIPFELQVLKAQAA